MNNDWNYMSSHLSIIENYYSQISQSTMELAADKRITKQLTRAPQALNIVGSELRTQQLAGYTPELLN